MFLFVLMLSRFRVTQQKKTPDDYDSFLFYNSVLGRDNRSQ